MTKRDNNINIYFNTEEYKQFREAFARSSDSKASVFARKLILGGPVCVYYRDRAFDDFIEVIIDFQKNISRMMQRPEWSEREKRQLETTMQEVHQLHIKIYDYVRKNKKS